MRTALQIASIIVFSFTIHHAFAGEGQGSWLPTQKIEKRFNAWSTQLTSGHANSRFYKDATRYVDQVKAVITLKTVPQVGDEIAGNLVFLSNDVKDLPIDLNLAGNVVLFYHYSDYTDVLKSLEVHQTGTVNWYYMREVQGGDVHVEQVLGSLSFDNKIPSK